MGSSEFSSDTIVQNEGIDSVRKKFCCNKEKNDKNKEKNDKNKEKNDKGCEESHIRLETLNWIYKYSNCHRIIELEFHCSKCHSDYYVLMDKTYYKDEKIGICSYKGKKNIEMRKVDFKNDHYQIYSYDAKKKNISYDHCLNVFNNIDPGYYNFATNNCKDFAYKLKNKILNNK